ncbi:glycosyltransferase family 2 protein [Kineosporia sp. J2-2]|uniref:Glycosyltransferase family 2 protein n=1 Tax=Kineosporia corallincola TaxID=2835133 RepID=A0ABS5T8P7_9ACTN|nr:glycosyltransferase [Kineosporia corallincola]MBT0767436.1 glycosyltransferase family 2 protein [Kineosporia corallincola]
MESSAQDGAVPAYELIIVSYNSRSQIEGLLAGLPGDIPLAIVDNARGADGLREMIQHRPNARYLEGAGQGFAMAANLGARTSSYEYVIFVNPDTRPTLTAFDALTSQLAAEPNVASSAATTVGNDGSVEIGAGGWEPSVRRAVIHAIGLHKLAPQAGLFAKPRPYLPIKVDWTTGACMAVRVSTFVALGGFDEQFYVYNEDVAFGRAVREHNFTQVLRTDVLVQHGAGNSGAPSKEMLRLRGASMARYVAQHNTLEHARGIRLALALGYATRVLAALAKGNKGRAQEHWNYILGVTSGRASVAGRTVTRA